MKKYRSIHAGHRERMLRNYVSGSSLTEVHKVEMLLFYCFRQGDTNEIAHRLLDTFGSIEELLLADEKDIAVIHGMGKASACKLRRLLDSARDYRRMLKKRSDVGGWHHDSVCAYLEERICPRLLRSDIGCVAVIFKSGFKADSFNISSVDMHLIKAINKQKEKGDISLLCMHPSSEDSLPISATEKDELSRIGIDAIASMSLQGKIKFDLI